MLTSAVNMAPVLPSSTGNVHLVPPVPFASRKVAVKIKYISDRTYARSIYFPQRVLFSRPSSINLLKKYATVATLMHESRFPTSVSVGSDVVVEDPSAAVESDDAPTSSDDSLASAEASGVSTSKEVTVTTAPSSRRSRPMRKSDMPPVNSEELVPGATFTGKVRSIQPFGAFVDFGAFTDGLVHVSRLSDSFVKDVNSVVSVGQEVKVKVIEANIDTGRISLTMREKDDSSKKDANVRSSIGAKKSDDKPQSSRKKPAKPSQNKDEKSKSSKFYKGQMLEGTVKNLARSGAFVSLPDGEEGFLPVSEESDGFASLLGDSQLQVGQEVSVRVLRINRGQVTLTMKKEENIKGANVQLNQGVVHVATNPFEMAFRQNKVIAAFLDERERMQKLAATSTVSHVAEEISVTDDQTKEDLDSIETSVDDKEVPVLSEVADFGTTSSSVVSSFGSLSSDNDDGSSTLHATSENFTKVSADSALTSIDPSETDIENVESALAGKESVEEVLKDDPSETDIENAEIALEEKTSVEELVNGGPSESHIEIVESALADKASVEEVWMSDPSETDIENVESALVEKASVEEVVNCDPSEIESPENGAASDLSLIGENVTSDSYNSVISSTETPAAEDISEAAQSAEVKAESESSNDAEDNLLNDGVGTDINIPVNDSPATPFAAKSGSEPNSSEKAGFPISQENTAKEKTATISAALVKQLREETGAGMMDCKKALAETGGDIVKAQVFLRKKGLASAEKKASRATAEGRVGSYIHDSRIGVLIEVNCETDFVSHGDIFKELVEDLAMQVAACPQVRYLVTEDVPEEIVSKEREIEMQKEDLLQKPEQIRAKIVDGRIKKRVEELALLEQPYIKNDKITVKDLVKQTISIIGENIKVKRFLRYNLGEGLEKKSQDFAAEVAAQTAGKAPTTSPGGQPAPDNKRTSENPPKTAVSAALVKQLREETGAGMMDCKKALAEMGGDLEKAQEYLRKKGLSSAEKKSLRLVTEGRVGSYIHDARIGVLIEVNCETDFVARGDIFKQLVDDLAMQVAACPQVEFVSVEDVPESIVRKEREMEIQREDLQSKPEQIRAKIVDGRVSKRLCELALLEQPFIKDDSLLVKDLVKQTVATLGENIRVRRFVHYTLGEESEKQNTEAS